MYSLYKLCIDVKKNSHRLPVSQAKKLKINSAPSSKKSGTYKKNSLCSIANIFQNIRLTSVFQTLCTPISPLSCRCYALRIFVSPLSCRCYALRIFVSSLSCRFYAFQILNSPLSCIYLYSAHRTFDSWFYHSVCPQLTFKKRLDFPIYHPVHQSAEIRHCVRRESKCAMRYCVLCVCVCVCLCELLSA